MVQEIAQPFWYYCEYGAGQVIARLKDTPLKVEYKEELHLSVSLRSAPGKDLKLIS